MAIGGSGGFYSRTFGDPAPAFCENCRRDTALVRRDSRVIWPEITDNLAPPFGPYTLESVWSCVHCNKATVIFDIYDEGESQSRSPVATRVVSPDRAPRELDEVVPEGIRSLFREGSVAERAGAMRAAGALYRAAVEALCDDRQCAGSKLFHKIEDLASKGVDVDVVGALHEARLLGNWSLHDGLEFSAEEVADVAQLIEDAVVVLYVQPAERSRLREARRVRRESFGASGA